MRKCLLVVVLFAVATFIAGCGGKSQVTITSPTPTTTTTTCTPTFTLSDLSFNGSGGTATLNVTAQTGCQWNMTLVGSWITASTTSGTGNMSGIVVTIAPNTTGAVRTGTITIGAQTLTVTQSAGTTTPTCTTTATLSNSSFTSSGGTATLAITATPGCSWAITIVGPWITASAVSGTGTGNVTNVAVTIAVNTDGARNGSITVGGQTLAVTQAAAPQQVCTYTIISASQRIGVAGTGTGTNGFAVNTQAGCTITPIPSGTWITITKVTMSNSTQGDVQYSVAQNTGITRPGAITVGNASLSIVQDGQDTCTFSALPTLPNIGSAGTGTGTNGFAVNTQAGCVIDPRPDVAWIRIVRVTMSNPAQGDVGYSVDANPNTTIRTGKIMVGNTTISVTQAGK